MFSKTNKKGFTLVEMLIVIVIIGVLAAALIPRLTSARGRANDVARKASLQQIATALVGYQIDNGSFPTTGWPLTAIKDALIKGGLSSVPTDPNSSRQFSGLSVTVTGWEFGYQPIKKNGIDNNGFVLMAATETEAWSNRVVENQITSSTTYESLTLCRTLSWSDTTAINGGACTYKTGTDVLRYITLY